MTDPTIDQIIAGMGEEMLDNMLHALGRPMLPEHVGHLHRNYYCCEPGSPAATAFAKSGLWTRGRVDDYYEYWSVNERGMTAVRAALRERG